MTAQDSITFIANLLTSLNSNNFESSEIKVKVKNPCHHLDFIKIFKTEEEIRAYISRFKSNSDCNSTDYLLLEGMIVKNKSLSDLSHIFNIYDIGNTLVINPKAVYDKFKVNSNKSKTKDYENLLSNLLKGYRSNRQQIVIPSIADFYVECCYVDDDYVD